jgi:hypothetical protein
MKGVTRHSLRAPRRSYVNSACPLRFPNTFTKSWITTPRADSECWHVLVAIWIEFTWSVLRWSSIWSSKGY